MSEPLGELLYGVDGEDLVLPGALEEELSEPVSEPDDDELPAAMRAAASGEPEREACCMILSSGKYSILLLDCVSTMTLEALRRISCMVDR